MPTRFLIGILALGLSGIAAPLRADEPAEAPKSANDRLAENARMVLAAIVKAAGDNQRLPEKERAGTRPPFRRGGDDLTVYYVRAAAAAARRLPEKEAAPAFLLALGIALDDSSLLRDNFLTRPLWKKVESSEARKQRLAVLGAPSLHGRHDLAQHFSVSAALTAIAGAAAAESAGVLKEVMDSRGGSGFSFADLAADFAGIAFARRVLDKPGRLSDIAERFRIGDYVLSPRGLPEGMNAADFARKYGSLQDERYLRLQKDIRQRIDGLPGYRGKE